MTPVEKLGQLPRIGSMAPDGQTVAYDTEAGNGLPGSPSHYADANADIARRTPAGWAGGSWNLPASEYAGASSGLVDMTVDHSALIFNLSTVEQNRNAESAFYVRRSAAEPPVRITPVLRNRQGATTNWRPRYAGATPDLTHVLMTTIGTNTLRDEDVSQAYSSGRNLYEVANAGTDQAALRRVDVDNAGERLGNPGCGAVFGSARRAGRSISADGRRIFFSAVRSGPGGGCGVVDSGPGSDPLRTFARVDGVATVEVSASECDRAPDPTATPRVEACVPAVGDARYESASDDGRRVWFTSPDQLADSDVDEQSDLYLYDFDAPDGSRLTQVSARDETTAAVQTLVAAAADGSRAYYLATGAVTDAPNAQGIAAVEGQPNLYEYDVLGNTTRFVATIDTGEGELWASGDGAVRRAQLASDTGRVLAFSTVAPVTSDDTDVASDVFRYDAVDDTLTRVSIGDGGDRGNTDSGSADIVGAAQDDAPLLRGLNRRVSADGSRIVVLTAERLTEADQNDALDAYEWHDGTIRLASDGRPSERGQESFPTNAIISADGTSVAFTTPRSLLAQDRDTGTDIYVARSGDDVTLPSPPAPLPCAGDACQQPPGPGLGVPPPVTPDFRGPGNDVPVPRVPAGTRLSVRAPGVVRGSRVTLRVTVSGRGRLVATGPRVRRSVKAAGRSGTYVVPVSLSARAARIVARRGRLITRVRIGFTTVNGGHSTVSARVTFQAKRSTTKRSIR